MKKITFYTIALAFLTQFGFAQDDMNVDTPEDYNKWSVDAGLGLVKAFTPFSDQYKTAEFGDLSYNLSVRYMFNEKFGLKVGGFYSQLENSGGSTPFETGLTTFTGEAVIGLGSILNFNEFADWLNVLGHAGVQVSSFNFDDAITSSDNDNTIGLVAGLTPQVKLSDRVALFADLSVIANAKHNAGIDGNPRPTRRDFDGFVAAASVGVTFYLGSNDKHADWVDNYSTKVFGERITQLENELDEIQNGMVDTDRDGVPDYLDREPNTVAGVAVNTKGESIDQNKNGIPDELESTLYQDFVTKDYANESMSSDAGAIVKSLANGGMINVYFQFDSTQPEYYSLNAIAQIVKYLEANPESEAVLTGYADEIGNSDYNTTLSENRAKRVYDVILDAGIDADRLSYKAGGIDNSVSKDSDTARQMVRRVTFELK